MTAAECRADGFVSRVFPPEDLVPAVPRHRGPGQRLSPAGSRASTGMSRPALARYRA